MKYEWRKKDKALYIPKTKPIVIDVPKMQYVTIRGEGNPNSKGFADCIGALYAMSYGIKMLPKSGITPRGHYDYAVFPLEGIWSLSDEGIEKYKKGLSAAELKDYFSYKIMVRQPEFVDQALVDLVKERVMAKKKKTPNIEDVLFEEIHEGKSIQMLHLGRYDDEPASFEKMEIFSKEAGYERIGKNHKEIYISDARRVAPEKLKTTLRFWVQ